MKPDKFDEAIRRKLEGIQPGFQDEDWAKFKAFKTNQAPTSFVQQFGRSMWYTAASVAAAVVVFANVYQYRQNRILDQQVAQLKQQLDQKQTPPVRISTRVDTVYITKYVPVETLHPQPDAYAQTLPQSNENELSANKNAAEDAVSVWEGLKNVSKIIRKNPNERISEAFGRPDSSDPETAGIKETDNPTVTSASDKNKLFSSKEKRATTAVQKETEGKNAGFSNRQSASVPQTKEGAGKNVAESIRSGFEKEAITETVNEASANTTPANQHEVALMEPNSMAELEGVPPAEVQVKRYAYAALQSKTTQSTAAGEANSTSPPPSISLKNIRFRAGGGLNIGDKYTGYNLMSSILLGKYWSLDVGIGKAKITGPEYFTEAVFNTKTGRPFQTWHKGDNVRPPLMPPQVFDIKTDVTLVRLPVSLTYRWPIKENFTLLFSGGTNLNLSAQQCYRFYYKERNDKIEEKEGNFNIKPAVSNDIMIAAGIEKQWRSIVFQAEAYAAPYLQKPAYLTDNRNLGVRFKVLYQFGKNPI